MIKEEKQRYNRHIIMPEIGMDGQLKLKKASVLVIGAGGLGCPVLQYLGAAGVGRIGIVDFDKVDASNLQRQILFGVADIGKFKAEVAKERLLANNPYIFVETHVTKLESANALSIIANYDIIVDGSDNFATRYLVNDACIILNKPLVFGAIYKFEGQLSVFNYQNGPSYRCLFPDQPSADSIPTCSQIGVVGVLSGIVGSMQANEVIKVILERDDVLSGRFLTIDILANSFFELIIERQESNFELKELSTYSDTCSSGFLELSPDELNDNYADYFVLDIRSKQERELCALEDSKHFLLDDLEQNISTLPRDQKMVVCCHYGIQSQKAVKLLVAKYGFVQVYNLSGGLQAWAQEVDGSFSY
jgi:sulfur-carrier protein adenylyltransferase/sulfurtransferase